MLLLNAAGHHLAEVPFWTSIPFIIMLLTIAVGPLVAEHWWERNRNKLIVSAVLAIPTAVYLKYSGLTLNLEHQIFGDYVPFIILLTALFVITGGIHIHGDIKATPRNNTIFLAIGFVLASIMGTTGAAMLLIRPVIATNDQRTFKMHTILFFIAIIANCGGLLTPLGDPPLLLLYLRGAEFTWFINMFPEWITTGGLLLIIYFIIDSYYYKKEHWTALSADAREVQPLKIEGTINLIYLAGVVFSVAFINPNVMPEMGEADAPKWLVFLREIVLLFLIALSWLTTKKTIRKANKFAWGPIIEVAVVFVGIFITMTPTLLFLNQHAESLGLTSPWQFFYCTGLLSAFLDNAPTAVAFWSVATNLPIAEGATIVAQVSEKILIAISSSAVFFGAMTYIGNGPNFMVKAIAEENGIKMPSFFGYIFKFSFIVLLPIYIIVQLLFI